MNTRHQIHHAIAATLFATTLAGFAPVGVAAGNAATSAFKGAVKVNDSELPATALRGTGLSGEFNATALNSPGVKIALSDGRAIVATRQRVAEDKAKGSKTWVGTFADQPGSIAVVTTYRGVTTGFISYGAETWEILPGKAGKHLLFRVDDGKLPKAEPVLFADDLASDSGSEYGTGGASADANGGYVHDLLVVYTPAARQAYGQSVLESMIQNAVAAANQAYLNSRIGITVNLVGLQEISYVESGDMKTSLYDIRGTTDGKMDDVHRLRDSVGADVVSLISQDSSSCGIAFAMRSESTSFASSAFNVVRPACLSQHSLAHEIGHNQGNMHDRENSTSSGVQPYSYGFKRCVSDGSGFRTVMSYSCSGAGRVTQFSNPSVLYNGYATGIAYETDPANSADNARSMNLTADSVAAFRAGSQSGSSSSPSPSAPTAPSGLSGGAASSTAVSLRWSDNSSDETGFKLERSGNGVDFTEIATLGAGATSYTDNGLSSRVTYYYRVRGYNSVGNSSYSNIASVTTPDVAPAMPTGIAVINNANGTATVSWGDGSNNETGFEVAREKWDAKRGVWSGRTTVGTVAANVASLVDAANNGTFRYSVRAINLGGGSAYAGPVSVTVTGGSTKGKSGR